MDRLSKLQRVVLYIGLALIVAALIGAPKYWNYCEKQALKAEFAAFVDVENWESGTEIRMGFPRKTLEAEDAIRIKEAIRKLEFDGEHTDERYIKRLYEGGGDFSMIRFVVAQRQRFWHVDIYYAAEYCIVDDFVVKNTDDLIQVVKDLQVKYPH